MRLFSKNFMPVKAMASNDFMKAVGSAKKEVQTNLETNIESFEQSFQDAVKTLGDFSENNKSATLKKAAHDFFRLIKQKPSRVEPYVYLSYILFLFDKKEEAKKYIKLAESIDPDYEFIKDVKSCIYKVEMPGLYSPVRKL